MGYSVNEIEQTKEWDSRLSQRRQYVVKIRSNVIDFVNKERQKMFTHLLGRRQGLQADQWF